MRTGEPFNCIVLPVFGGDGACCKAPGCTTGVTLFSPRFATSSELDLPRRRLRNVSSGVLQHRVNTIKQFVVAKWLGEVTRRPSIHRLGARAVIGENGNEDDRDYG